MKESINLLKQALELLQRPLISAVEYNNALKDIRKVIIYLETQPQHSISWDIDDFEQRAVELEDEEKDLADNETLYDRSKFQGALELMISRHDCNVGISWDIVDDYLNNYCKWK